MAEENFDQELATIKKVTDPPEVVSTEEYEKRIREIAKCKKDIVYFAEKYYRIVNLDRGLEIIKLYDVQKDFLKFLTLNNKVVCTSGRQQGKCEFRKSKITVRNKKTGKIQEMTVEDFHNLCKAKTLEK